MVNNFTCACQNGYTGRLCNSIFDTCTTKPCVNNGTCSSSFLNFSCACKNGFEGKRCEIGMSCRVISCLSVPLMGVRHLIIADWCLNVTCRNGGWCNRTARKCNCTNGYSGALCTVQPLQPLSSASDAAGSTSSSWLIGVVVAVAVAFVIVVLVAVFIVVRRRQRRRGYDAQATKLSSKPFDWQGIDDSPEVSNVPIPSVGNFESVNQDASLELKPFPRSRATVDAQVKYLEAQILSGVEPAACVTAFRSIPKSKAGATINAATSERYKPLNRYTNILAYDDTRVKISDRGHGDYINANHINKTIGSRRFWYIATQGPLAKTVPDFWQMVWEQNSRVIVMLASLVENGTPKCECYWPKVEGEDGAQSYGDYSTVLLSSQSFESFVMRAIQLRDVTTGEKRVVWQLHYTAWPDHGEPRSPAALLAFLAKVAEARKHAPIAVNSPVVVHCSAGVGRTGVLILVELLLAQLAAGELPAPAALLSELREQRAALVQTPDQFLFAHSAALHHLQADYGAQASVTSF